MRGLGAPGPAGAAAVVAPCGDSTPGDLDGDGRADLIVGLPSWEETVPGSVDVRYSRLPSTELRASDVAGTRVGGANWFGTVVVAADLDRDGCADAVIGSPGERSADDERRQVGRVHILFGSPTGLLAAEAVTVPLPRAAQRSRTAFGETVALSRRTTGPGYDLFVGAPDTAVDAAGTSGAVWRFPITPGGADRVTFGAGSTVTPVSPGFPGQPSYRFGSVLTPDGAGGVVASAPGEDVDGKPNSGAVYHLRGDHTGWTTVTRFVQGADGVPGTVERGDKFGTTLASRGRWVLVGAPEENVGTQRNAGLVQVFERMPDGTLRPGPAYTRDTPGIPGTARALDYFGAGLTAGAGLTCPGGVDAAVGVPLADRSAGLVALIPLPGPTARCPARVLRQGDGLNGRAEPNDGVSRVLTVSPDGHRDRLVVGVPHGTVGPHRAAGLVLTDRRSIDVAGIRVPWLTYSGVVRDGTMYGWVLNSVA